MVQSSSCAGLLAITASLLFTSVSAHMTLAQPAPLGSDILTNSPISDASHYPCNLPQGQTWKEAATPNVFAVGEPQTLAFKGSAVHGGGSCQVSFTTDKQPTASSKWQVIHSIVGGCPSNAAGNLADGTNDASTFKFTVPDGVAPGDYTFAWTWFNKIGNREMYMNCFHGQVTASKKRYAPQQSAAKRQTSFPDMAVANLPFVNSCKTVEGGNVEFPNPGSSLETLVSADQINQFTGDGCTASGTSGGSGSSSGSGSGSGSSSAPASSAPAATSSAAAITQSSAGVFAPSSTSAAPAVPTVAPVESSAAASAPAPSATASSSSGSASGSGSNTTSGSATQGASCTTEGASICAADGQSYMICASGYYQKMPVAAGTKCSGSGVQANVNIIANPVKRHSHARQHIRRNKDF